MPPTAIHPQPSAAVVSSAPHSPSPSAPLNRRSRPVRSAAFRAEVLAALKRDLAAGVPFTTAAERLGICRQTLYRWLRGPVTRKPRGLTPSQRKARVAIYQQARGEGLTVARSARRAGASHASLWRWRKGRLGGQAPAPKAPQQLAALGLAWDTVEVIQEYRVHSSDAPSAIRQAIRDRRVRPSQARVLRPYGRQTLPMPPALARVLAVKVVHLLKVTCGEAESLRRTGPSRGGVRR